MRARPFAYDFASGQDDVGTRRHIALGMTSAEGKSSTGGSFSLLAILGRGMLIFAASGELAGRNIGARRNT
jgi:hypothetical protein